MANVLKYREEGDQPGDSPRSPFADVRPVSIAEIEPESALDEILTPRECEVAFGVYEGLSNKEIARSLEISPWTVSSHLRQVFAKLGITRRIELCRLWHQNAAKSQFD
ncbi:response regulator transcription factor [Erythrobacter sp. HKB08]|uniref:response regulator transcription factor n=1 Tax=Erythrobacter sp. HKB08 TaxID=2502843 RepID=UPI0013E8E678|nr:helix-turn-helix transcriptional regulator [Erythrobacter sp. HKB08]